MQIYGKDILLSHRPVVDCGYDLNIHGHCHRNGHHDGEPELDAVLNSKQRLIYIEHEYRPFRLRKLVEG